MERERRKEKRERGNGEQKRVKKENGAMRERQENE